MPPKAHAKIPFASAAWIDKARQVLEELVVSHGEAGRRFSVCERSTAAPLEVSATGVAAWHFKIDGTSVVVGPGDFPDADVVITADYQTTLPNARLVYTPEILAQRAADRAANPSPNVKGDMAKAPPYLVELHNQLAAVTA